MMNECYAEQVQRQIARELEVVGRPITLMEKFCDEEKRLKERLRDVQAAKAILQTNPEMEKLFSIMMRSERRYL